MRKVLAALLMAAVMGGTSNLALADDVSNDLDNTVDATAEVVSVNVGGPSEAIIFNVIPQNGDGKNGCNFTGQKVLTVSLSVADSGIAAVSPTSLTFDNCSFGQPVTVTGLAVGSTTVTLTQVLNETNGTFSLAPGTFRVDVAPELDTTAPVITPTVTGTLGDNGYYTSDVTVSWTIVDPESAITSMSGCGTVTVTTDTAGATFTCIATSQGGTSSQSVTIKRDATAPIITAAATVNGNPYIGAWTNQDVVVTFSCDASVSGSASLTSPVTLTAEGANQMASGTCVDNAGNAASATFTGINIDKTAPAYGTPFRASGFEANLNGWNNTDVTVNFPCNDAGSGPLVAIIVKTVTTEGMNQSAAADAVECVDVAGNVAVLGSSLGSINIDKTVPVIVAGAPTGTLGTNGFYITPVAVPFSATDDLSGFDALGTLTATLMSKSTIGDGLALTVASDTITDQAGNVAVIVVAGPFKVDTTAPVITFVSAVPVPNAAGWNKTDVVLTWNCADSVSSVVESTIVQVLSTEGVDQSATAICTNGAGLTAFDTQSGIDIDRTAPTVTAANHGAGYLVGEVGATVSYSCADALSGIASCLGSVANGSSIDTSVQGPRSYTVTATDVAGNVTVKTVTYSVYGFNCPLPPISNDLKSFKKTSTIPVKCQLTDGAGHFFGGANLKLMIKDATANSTWVSAVSSGKANELNNFRYDPAAQQYIFNMATSMSVFVPGHAYSLRISTPTTSVLKELVNIIKIK